MKPLVSVIIVNFNHKYFPKIAIEALEKSKTEFPFEIIFVDNASSDQSIDFLHQAHKENRIKLIALKENIGFGAGNNVGFKAAQGKYLYIHNPDVAVEPDTLQKMVDYFEKNPETGILGTKLKYYNGDIQESCRRNMSFADLIIKRTILKRFNPWKDRLKKYLMQDFNHNQTQEVDLLTGASLFGEKKFLYDQIGGFDERYFLFMEDFDLCRMVNKAGKKVVYFPEASVLHYHKRLSGGGFFEQFFKKTFWFHFSSAIKYFWKWR